MQEVLNHLFLLPENAKRVTVVPTHWVNSRPLEKPVMFSPLPSDDELLVQMVSAVGSSSSSSLALSRQFDRDRWEPQDLLVHFAGGDPLSSGRQGHGRRSAAGDGRVMEE